MRIIRDRAKTVDLDDFLSRPLFGHLATTSKAGPRSSPIWFLWEDGAIWIMGNRKSDTFPARIEQHPQSALSVVDFDRAAGRVHHVGLRGRASLQLFDKERAKRLLCRYLGAQEDQWDAKRFVEPLDEPDNVFVRFEPDTVVARDQSYRASPDL